MCDGTQSHSRVLTCDDNGAGTWQDIKLHVIKGNTSDDNIEFTVPAVTQYGTTDGFTYYQSLAVVVSPNNYIVLPPGVWKVEFSFPVMVRENVDNLDWLEGLVFFSTSPSITNYDTRRTATQEGRVGDGIAIPHFSQCTPGYIERGFGWCFINNNTNAPMTCYMGFGRCNVNRERASYPNQWFGKTLTLLPTNRTPYLYATMVGNDFLTQ